MATAHASPPVPPRSYLLRVTRTRGDGARYLLQDLRTGERHEFGDEAALRAFLSTRQRPQALR